MDISLFSNFVVKYMVMLFISSLIIFSFSKHNTFKFWGLFLVTKFDVIKVCKVIVNNIKQANHQVRFAAWQVKR